jgi:hypothetical protein
VLFVRFVASVFLATVGPAAVLAQEWVVDRAIQPAHFMHDPALENSEYGEEELLLVAAQASEEKWVVLEPGMAVPDGSWVRTGDTGRLQLSRGDELIQFKPETVASVLTWNERGTLLTHIQQVVGSILFEIETRDTQHTMVETPFLAGLVKGTRFTVVVSEVQASLQVDHGIVEVIDLHRAERVDVRARQSVDVMQASIQSMAVQGPGPKDKVAQFIPPPRDRGEGSYWVPISQNDEVALSTQSQSVVDAGTMPPETANLSAPTNIETRAASSEQLTSANAQRAAGGGVLLSKLAPRLSWNNQHGWNGSTKRASRGRVGGDTPERDQDQFELEATEQGSSQKDNVGGRPVGGVTSDTLSVLKDDRSSPSDSSVGARRPQHAVQGESGRQHSHKPEPVAKQGPEREDSDRSPPVTEQNNDGEGTVTVERIASSILKGITERIVAEPSPSRPAPDVDQPPAAQPGSISDRIADQMRQIILDRIISDITEELRKPDGDHALDEYARIQAERRADRIMDGLDGVRIESQADRIADRIASQVSKQLSRGRDADVIGRDAERRAERQADRAAERIVQDIANAEIERVVQRISESRRERATAAQLRKVRKAERREERLRLSVSSQTDSRNEGSSSASPETSQANRDNTPVLGMLLDVPGVDQTRAVEVTFRPVIPQTEERETVSPFEAMKIEDHALLVEHTAWATIPMASPNELRLPVLSDLSDADFPNAQPGGIAALALESDMMIVSNDKQLIREPSTLNEVKPVPLPSSGIVFLIGILAFYGVRIKAVRKSA